MRRIAVDLDGTLIEDDKWPDMGEWLPGAREALKTLAAEYDEVVILTCRTANRERDEITHRNPEDQISAIEDLLLDAEIPENVYVWTLPFKPNADFYLDNKALRFTGNWGGTLNQIKTLQAVERVG